MITKPVAGEAAEFFDRHGADRAAWPFAARTEAARHEASEPGWATAETEAARLESILGKIALELDAEVSAMASAQRIAASLTPKLPRRSFAQTRWVALAATLLLAAGLGSLADLTLRVDQVPSPTDAVLGTQLLGPDEVGQE